MVSIDNTCQRILEYYYRKEGYGPPIEASETQEGFDEPWTRGEHFPSPFPLATEEQIRLTEEAMGFPYPPLLRNLYLNVGNGGFGPGLGLVGVFPTDSEIGIYIDDKERILERYLRPYSLEDQTLIDLEQYEAQHGQLKDMNLSDVWPKYLIFLCNWGCGGFSFLHAKTGRVYLSTDGYLSYEADSLEQWLERWLQEAHTQLSFVDSYVIDSSLIE